MTKALTSLVLAALVAFAPSSYAQYPDRPVSIVVPWPPGDLEDVLSRLIAEDFEKEYGVPTAVVNKPSDGGPFPGAVEVAKAPADGSMIGSFVVGVPVVGPQIGIPELNPDPFEPLGIFLTYPFVIATSKDAPYKSMEELATYAKENKVALGHFGPPLVPTKITLALAKSMGFSFGSDAAFANIDCNTLASGDVDVVNTTIQLILPCLEKVNVLAAVTGERINILPDTRTVAEINPNLNMILWNGLFVHKDTPADVREKIIAVAKKTMVSDRAKKIAKDTGAIIYWEDAETAKTHIANDIEAFAAINKMLEK